MRDPSRVGVGTFRSPGWDVSGGLGDRDRRSEFWAGEGRASGEATGGMRRAGNGRAVPRRREKTSGKRRAGEEMDLSSTL